MEYNFAKLSPADFEELVHDLLEAEWGIALESFKSGRDCGIDLRHIALDGGATVVQCKRYIDTKFPDLRSHMKIKEMPKIRSLSPQRYVLVTALPLLEEQKEKLFQDLQPFVRRREDIIGGTEVQDLIRRHKKVEIAHYKLWLTSTAVLQEVLRQVVLAPELRKAEFLVDGIQKSLPLYVQGPAYQQAQDILQDQRVLIISGLPGIGKSTLAEMLVYAHMANGYTPFKVENHISEARKVFDRDAETIYYFDDFLGETFLGDRVNQAGRSHDDPLLEFIAAIGDSKSRFILTTREHILSSALFRSERLAHSHLGKTRFLLELGHYGRAERARILYNHIHFSALPAAHREELTRDDFFLQIIDHEKFNPRVIRWLTNYASIQSIAVEDYRGHVMALMANPAEVWRHAFNSEISPAARCLLLVLYTLGGAYDADQLGHAFEALYRHASRRYNFRTAPGDFRLALRELDNAFTKSDLTLAVKFLNPSIRDYVASIFESSIDDVEDVVATTTRFQQGATLWALAAATPESALARWIDTHRHVFLDALARCLAPYTGSWRHASVRPGLFFVRVDLDMDSRIRLLLDIYRAWRSADVVAVAAEAVDAWVKSWAKSAVDYEDAVAVFRAMTSSPWFIENGGATIAQMLEDGLADHLDEALSWHWSEILGARDDNLLIGDRMNAAVHDALHAFLEDGVGDEISNTQSENDQESLLATLEGLQSRYGFNLRGSIESLQEQLAERSNDDSHGDGGGEGWRRPVAAGRDADDDEIRTLFGASD
jgi:hypothetical protein